MLTLSYGGVLVGVNHFICVGVAMTAYGLLTIRS
jgi:hypothetical protein